MEYEKVRKHISEALLPTNRAFAEMIARSSAIQVSPYETAFFRHYQLYKIEQLHRPALFYVAYAPREVVYLLTGQPRNFSKVARIEEVQITTEAEAIAYSVFYLEVTRVRSSLFLMLEELSQIPFRSVLNLQEEQRKADLLTRYREVLQSPQARQGDQGYEVLFYTVRGQALERHTLLLRRDGSIEDRVTVLDEDLPLVYSYA